MDNQQQSLIGAVKHKEYNLLITSDGRIFNLDGTPRWSSPDRRGYLYTQILIDGKIKSLTIHRLVAETFLPPPSKELVEKCSKEHWGKVLVLHNDNDKLNNNISNLRWGTLKENSVQAQEDGLMFHTLGENNGRAKLTEKEVHEICKFFEDGGTAKQATSKFKLNENQANKIRIGATWKHISCQYNIKPIKCAQRSVERRSLKRGETGDTTEENSVGEDMI